MTLTRTAPIRTGPDLGSEVVAQGHATKVLLLRERLASWKLWCLSAAIFLPFAFVFFAGSAPFSIPEVDAACGQVPLDMRVFTSGDGVVDFLDACGPDGRRSYTNLQLADLVYPLIVGSFLAASLALATKKLSNTSTTLSWLIALPLLATGFDYTENACAWLAIRSYPDPILTNEILGIASAAKSVTSWAAGMALIGCLIVVGFRRDGSGDPRFRVGQFGRTASAGSSRAARVAG